MIIITAKGGGGKGEEKEIERISCGWFEYFNILSN